MSQPAATLALDLTHSRPRLIYYFALTKPKVVLMVLITTLAGFYLGSRGGFDLLIALQLMIGTSLAAGGTLALNQYMERDLDARMERTRTRPLPDGKLYPGEALVFGAGLAVVGAAYLYYTVNPLTAAITASITVVYLAAYTPLKRVSSFCSVVGAIPGALPPVAGWAAARGSADAPSWVLFAIMFLWQLPHSLAIAQLYSEDYRRAGIRLLPTDDPGGGATGRQIVSNSIALMAAAMLPPLFGLAGSVYGAVALLLGSGFLISGIRLARTPSVAAARQVMVASLIYLPVLLLVMVLDKA